MIVLFRRLVGVSLLDPLVFRTPDSEVFEVDPARRTCQTGLLRPTWTPERPGLLGHFRDLDSPAELLREQGALLTFRVTGDPVNNLGRVLAFPADLLRENGHMLMFNSAELAPFPLFFFSLFFFFPFSSEELLFSSLFFSLFLKMSFHRFDAENDVVTDESVMAGDGSVVDPGTGSGGSDMRVSVSGRCVEADGPELF